MLQKKVRSALWVGQQPSPTRAEIQHRGFLSYQEGRPSPKKMGFQILMTFELRCRCLCVLQTPGAIFNSERDQKGILQQLVDIIWIPCV